ncbi:MAG: ATP-binding cassette domain-containing protein [Pelagimonas sp.]|jgi:ABC-2 type transport system ATP-binding protein|nr:ATP-binding cassette domain-containing protein [Pelagimonas sp.]
MSIETENLTYLYGTKRALDRVSFTVSPGRVTALLGPNGAGKSTLFGLLTRLMSAPAGRIRIAGHDLAQEPRAALALMGLVFQQTTLDLDLTVRQNLRYFAALHGITGRRAHERIHEVLAQLDMCERADEKARNLNGGHRRRTEIARALLHQPKVLLLDEPTVGLDAATRESITRYLHDLAIENHLTLLWATHLTDEVYDQDDIVLLHRGRVLHQGRAEVLRGANSLKDWFLACTQTEPQTGALAQPRGEL